MTSPGNPDPQRLSVASGWLVHDVGRHTCAGGTPESGYAHEPSCGLEPIMTLDELAALFDVIAEQGVPINRPRLAIAAAERRGRVEALRPFEELFAGGPDTPCRTTWRREAGHSLPGGSVPPTECVEVPLDDLRAAFDAAAPDDDTTEAGSS